MGPARLLGTYALLHLAFLYAPVLVLPLFALNDATLMAFPLRGLTLRWFEQALADASMREALAASLMVAIPVALVSTALALPAALALTRRDAPFRGLATAILLSPMAAPPLVVGVSLVSLVTRGLGLPLSLWTVALGHVLVCLPFAVAVLAARLDGLDRSLIEASMDLGQGPVSTFLRVILPIAAPGVAASLLLSAIVSFDEFMIAFFLSGADATLPVYIWGSLRFPAKLPMTLALGSMILVATVTLATVAELWRRRTERGP